MPANLGEVGGAGNAERVFAELFGQFGVPVAEFDEPRAVAPDPSRALVFREPPVFEGCQVAFDRRFGLGDLGVDRGQFPFTGVAFRLCALPCIPGGRVPPTSRGTPGRTCGGLVRVPPLN